MAFSDVAVDLTIWNMEFPTRNAKKGDAIVINPAFSMEIQKIRKAVLHNSEISVGDSKRKVL